MDNILELLAREGRLSDRELAERTGMDEQQIARQRAAWEQDGTILGYQAIINDGEESDLGVFAFIEVRMTPERGGGFDRLANRISRFEEVQSCYLASGGFDLLVTVQGDTMRQIANFVAEKLATLDGVISTSTHFHLKTYKKGGFIYETPATDQRLAVSP